MRQLVVSAALALIALLHVDASQSETASLVKVNDNRVAAGRLSNGVLTIALEARSGKWFPDGDDKPGVTVKAFAVAGGPLQNPGPLVRVPEGTEIRATIHNSLSAEPLALHGMYTRPGRDADATALMIPPGETREVRFTAGQPGTYFYWGAADSKVEVGGRVGADSQLSGAIVVDPRGGSAPDRVLVIAFWGNGAPGAPPAPGDRGRFSINGRSWPHTERLSYRVGDTIRMRLINVSGAPHPMHLHGFYYNVDSRGDERTNTVFAAGSSPHMVVTERMTTGTTYSLTWKPTRPGNWLFHCHDNAHLDYGGPLDREGVYEPEHTHGADHMDMMAGLVMGISVTGTTMEAPEPTSTRRQLRLLAKVDEGSTAAEPAFGFVLDSLGHAQGASLQPSSTILLKRGEPVSVTVVNQLQEPTSVHWHGIELQSYYDGVPGFGGDGTRVSPSIAAGGKFEARFTPPRSGTFIYHTHMDDTRQMRAGLSGPLIVVDDPAAFDPRHDLVFMITAPRKRADDRKVLINGSLAPAPLEFAVGEHYRLRFINAHTNRAAMRMRLLKGDQPLAWRSVAKDGMDLPADQSVEGASEVQMGNGETYDFDFVPIEPGDIKFNVVSANYTLLNAVPIKVR